KNPYSGLVQGTDGNFYGTTRGGGPRNFGTVFKMTPAGELTTLHFFTGNDGIEPRGSLVQGADGDFYGTTLYGGAGYGAGQPWGNNGTVFKITPAGALSTLYSFWVTAYPYAGLVQGTDGNFYGTTAYGGTSGVGTVFSITPSGTLTRIRSFSGGDGANPYAALVQGTDGSFYGTTAHGGPAGGGVVFRLTLGPGPSPTVTGVSPASGPVSGGTVVTISGTDFQPGSSVSFGGAAASGVTYLSATTIHALAPVHAAGPVAVIVTNPDLQAGSLSSAYTYACPWTPAAFNGGPICVGGTISLSTPMVSGATYAWTGPNGFTSALQNPTIAAATTAATGAYSVTVTAVGCESVPGTTWVVVNPAPAAPAITAPSIVGAGSPNRTASVSLHAGSSYSWTIGNGTMTSGQGTSQITFTGGTAGTPLTLSVTETNTSGCVSTPGNATVTVAPAGSAVPFFTLTPCRAVDTRIPIGQFGAPPLQPGATRMFDMAASSCGIPADAVAISVNMTVTNVGAQGELVVFPSDISRPNTSSISFRAGSTRANNAIVFFSKTSATFSVFDNSAAPVDFILDVNGFFR
ncbi:MAG: IPT/TIG domain-containing protein, partial [Thermoanaerobaculia bacterium]|nr:IPT/TIG domain-containing protein [Thermoanaerobaculia bacterium]